MSSKVQRQHLPFASRVVACYRDWKSLLAARGLEEKANWVLVDDICNSETNTHPFSSDGEVSAELQTLLDLCPVEERNLGKDYAYTQAKLRQSLIYSQQAGDEKVTRADAEARGVKWIEVSDAQLDALHAAYLAQRQVADEFLHAKGEDPAQYYTEWLPGAEAAKFIKEIGDQWVTRFQKLFPFIPSVDYECVALDIDMPFQNLVVYKPRKFTLLMNTRTEKAFTRAHLTFLALHEICGHIVHFTFMRDTAAVQQNSSQLLPLAIHTQDSFLVEGVAQILSMIVHAPFAKDFPEVGAQIQVSNLYVAVRHANVSDLIEGKITAAQAAKKHQKYLGGNVEALEKWYESRMNDAFGCIQALNYYSSVHMLSPFLGLSFDRQAKGLPLLMTSFLAPSDVQAFLSAASH